MEDNNLIDNKIFQEFPLPKIKWRNEFWLAFIPYLISFILLFFPELVNLTRYVKLRNILGISLLFLPLFITLLDWFIRWIKAVKNRVENYELLLNASENIVHDFGVYKENVSVFINEFHKLLEPFEVIEANYTDKSIFVVIRKNSRIHLMEGDRLLIIDKKYNSIIGYFSIINILENCYYALGQPGLDPIWAGYVREKGKVDFLPYTQAFLFTDGDNHDN